MTILIVLSILAIGVTLLPTYLRYSHSDYGACSGNNFRQTLQDKGNYGEFLTFHKLEKLPGYKRLLANIYVPRNDGTTTEVDLVMLHDTGVYVFESKNYSGWIFGNESNRNWTQTLSHGKQKNHFLNPIWQNQSHMRAVMDKLAEVPESAFRSYIVFGERCTLRDITVTSANVKVIKRNTLTKTIESEIATAPVLFGKLQMDLLHDQLAPFALASNEIRSRHISDIQQKVAGKNPS